MEAEKPPGQPAHHQSLESGRLCPPSGETDQERAEREQTNRRVALRLAKLHQLRETADQETRQGAQIIRELQKYGVHPGWYQFPKGERRDPVVQMLVESYPSLDRFSRLDLSSLTQKSKPEKQLAEWLNRAQRRARNELSIFNDMIRFDHGPNELIAPQKIWNPLVVQQMHATRNQIEKEGRRRGYKLQQQEKYAQLIHQLAGQVIRNL